MTGTMTEFLTLNQRYIKPPNIGLQIRYGFWAVVVIVMLFYSLTSFIELVINRFFTVTDRDYMEEA